MGPRGGAPCRMTRTRPAAGFRTSAGGRLSRSRAPFDPDGIGTQEKWDYLTQMLVINRDKVETYLRKFPNATFHAGKKPWEQKVDIAMPRATASSHSAAPTRTAPPVTAYQMAGPTAATAETANPSPAAGSAIPRSHGPSFVHESVVRERPLEAIGIDTRVGPMTPTAASTGFATTTFRPGASACLRNPGRILLSSSDSCRHSARRAFRSSGEGRSPACTRSRGLSS